MKRNAKPLAKALTRMQGVLESRLYDSNRESIADVLRAVAVAISRDDYVSQFGGDDATSLRAMADRIERWEGGES